jgi:hypothetical protein
LRASGLSAAWLKPDEIAFSFVLGHGNKGYFIFLDNNYHWIIIFRCLVSRKNVALLGAFFGFSFPVQTSGGLNLPAICCVSRQLIEALTPLENLVV